MAERLSDQAAGLRRLLAPAAPLVVSVATARPGGGQAWSVLNLADALRLAGADVLVLDAASGGPGGLTGDAADRHALHAVLTGQRSLAQAVLHGPEGIPVLPAQSAGHDWLAAGLLPGALAAALARVLHGYDLVLVNLPGGAAGRSAAPALRGTQRLLMVGVEASDIAAARAWLQAAADDGEAVRVLVCGAADARAAARVQAELLHGLDRSRAGAVQAAGYLPGDPLWRDAASQGRTVVRSLPAAPAARAFRRLADTLTRLRPAASRQAKTNDFQRAAGPLVLTA